MSAVVGREGKYTKNPGRNRCHNKVGKNATKCYVVGIRENVEKANALIDEAIEGERNSRPGKKAKSGENGGRRKHHHNGSQFSKYQCKRRTEVKNKTGL